MFGLSKDEKQAKLNNQFKSEFKDLLITMNSSLERSGLVASIRGTSGGYDFADTLHNIYCDFGYPAEINFTKAWNMFRRFGPAAAVVNTPPNLSWLIPPDIQPTNEGNEKFNREFKLLVKKTNLWNRLKGLDKRQRVGQYAGLFIQVADNKKPSEPVEGLNSIAQVHNLKPIYEGQLKVSTTGQDVKEPNYGQPTMYRFQPSQDGSRNRDENATVEIHPTRIIIAAEGADDGSIYGISALENIYNDLMDLRKISGAGGEGFYQNTRNAPVIEVDKEFKSPNQKAADALETELDNFLGKWQKKFVAKGMKFVYPNIKLDNPKDFAENSWNNISAGSGIPSNELRGVQTGVLAGDKDNRAKLTMIQSRRENFLNELVTDVVDWFMLHGVIETVEYEIVWDDLIEAGREQRLTNAKTMTEMNQVQSNAGQPAVYEVDEIREEAGDVPLEEEIPSEDLNKEEDEKDALENDEENN